MLAALWSESIRQVLVDRVQDCDGHPLDELPSRAATASARYRPFWGTLLDLFSNAAPLVRSQLHSRQRRSMRVIRHSNRAQLLFSAVAPLKLADVDLLRILAKSI
jgi:hypothetical protein